jgi:hypothetical protein
MSEPEAAQKKPRKRGRLLVFATLVALCLCMMPSGWNYYRVAGVQNTLVRNWEIRFDKDGKPDAMPKILDDEVVELLGTADSKWMGEVRWEVYRERVRALFRGRIEEMIIYEHNGFRGDLGASLLHFPELKKLTVFELGEQMPLEEELKLLCLRLRELTGLEELELAGDQLSSDALTPLAGHPKLRRIRLSDSNRLTTDVLETLKTLPALKYVEIEDIWGPDEEMWKSPQLHARLREALPGVMLTLPLP